MLPYREGAMYEGYPGTRVCEGKPGVFILTTALVIG